jgi:hypothetical protein
MTKPPESLVIHGVGRDSPDASRRLAIVYARLLALTDGRAKGGRVGSHSSPETVALGDAEQPVSSVGTVLRESVETGTEQDSQEGARQCVN